MPTKYLQHFPKPVLDDLLNGRWLPVVGAGMSMNAKVPKGKKMPLWSDMGKQLEDDLGYASSGGPLDAISAFEHEFGRPKLIERLSEILLSRDAQPGEAHRAFCSIPFDLVCTTNFDILLERQYDLTPRYVYPVVDEEQLSLNVTSDGTLLLKLHGDLRHPSRLVVTEGDYDAFLAGYPLLATYLANLLITKTAVLVGYSLDDPDFRQIWNVVAQRLGRARRNAYAIVVGANPSDIARFLRRGVIAINLPGSRERYGDILATCFDELAEYWRDRLITVSTVTEEEPLRELLLPKETKTRLCFLAVPLHRLPLYKERVFPALERLDFVPITSDDVISPGDSISAKTDALMERAALIIVEIGTAWTLAELWLALGRLRSRSGSDKGRTEPQVVVVRTGTEPLPSNLDHTRLQIINLDEEDAKSLEELIASLPNIVPYLARLDEALRLLGAGEHRAAVIAAMSYLETELRRQLDLPALHRVRRPMSLRGLLNEAVDKQIIKATSAATVDQWIALRNEAVHANVLVTKQKATEVVKGVTALFPQT
jgi:SIR2-like domain